MSLRFFFSVHCPVGFNYSVAELSKCYAVLSERVDWNTAQQKCRQLHINAQLIVINDSREAQITSEILQDHGIIPLYNIFRYLCNVNTCISHHVQHNYGVSLDGR